MDQPGRLSADVDAQSLADKLAAFDAALPPRQQALFRSLILRALEHSEDVEGHRMGQRWDSGPNGLYRTWVYIDDNIDKIDPKRWDTLSVRTDASPRAAVADVKAEGSA